MDENVLKIGLNEQIYFLRVCKAKNLATSIELMSPYSFIHLIIKLET